jgi:transposase-like protein
MNDRQFFPSRRDLGAAQPAQRVTASPAAPASAPSVQTQKGFGGVPSAVRVQQLAVPARAPASAAATPVVSTAPSAACIQSPLAFAVFLFGPGADALREFVNEIGPFLDAESGDVVHWLVLGDPRRSEANFRAYLAQRGITLDQMHEDWRRLVADSADGEHAVSVETAELASAHGLTVDDLPVLLVFIPGTTDAPLHVRLPKQAGSSIEIARETIAILRRHLGKDILVGKIQRVTRGKPAELVIVVTSQARKARHELDALERSFARTDKPVETDRKQQALSRIILDGATVAAAARAVGISRQACYKDKKTRDAIFKSAGRRNAKQSTPREGSKRDGVIETSADSGGDAPDQ